MSGKSKIIWKVDENDQYSAFVERENGRQSKAIWAPQPGSQEAFLTCPVFEALYTSGRGIGKTDTLIMDFAKDVGVGHGIEWRGILFRRHFPEFKDVIAKTHKWFYQIWERDKEVKYNASEHTWTWATGEQLIFRQLNKPEDYTKLHGSSFTWMGFEELTNWPTDEAFRKCFSLLRSSDKATAKKIRVRSTTNPSGCVPYGDVLTARGWVPIQDVTTDDVVLSVTPTGETVYRPVTETHTYDFDGQLKKTESGMIFTEDHRFPHLNTDESLHTVRPFTELPQYAKIRAVGNANSSTLPSIYITADSEMADRYVERCLKSGLICNVSQSRFGHVITASNNNVLTLGPTKDTPHTGKVYCLTVTDTETFFIRQKGCIWLSGNSGHSWVKDRYHLPVESGKIIGEIIKDGSHPRVAIHGHLEENKVLLHSTPNYVETLRESATSEYQLQAWLEGDWNIVAGGMFDDVWSPEHQVIEGFNVKQAIYNGWKIDRSYDHGQSKPFSVGWWAESNGIPVYLPNGTSVGHVKGDLVRFAEWYGCGKKSNEGLRMLTSDIAKGIRKREMDWGIRKHIERGPADASIFDPIEPNKSIAGEFYKEGVLWLPADKGKGSREHGWTLIRERLAAAKAVVKENPALYISNNCKSFIRVIPTLPRDENNIDDVDTNSEDHIADEVRYRVRAKIRKAWTTHF